MNKTNNNYAKEMYVSPVAKTVELELYSACLVTTSAPEARGRASWGYEDNNMGSI